MSYVFRGEEQYAKDWQALCWREGHMKRLPSLGETKKQRRPMKISAEQMRRVLEDVRRQPQDTHAARAKRCKMLPNQIANRLRELVQRKHIMRDTTCKNGDIAGPRFYLTQAGVDWLPFEDVDQ